MIHTPAATKKKKKVERKKKNREDQLCVLEVKKRKENAYGESGIRSLMDIKRSSMSADYYFFVQ